VNDVESGSTVLVIKSSPFTNRAPASAAARATNDSSQDETPASSRRCMIASRFAHGAKPNSVQDCMAMAFFVPPLETDEKKSFTATILVETPRIGSTISLA
jgi:hypothetical protein